MKILGKELTFNGNKVYHAGNKPTASEIGAAASSHTHNYAGSSSAGGNANAAVKLATARTINGTNFDGTENITTANWGTARNLNGVSVNGSTNYTIPVENYYCSVGNNNTNLYHRILTTDIATANFVDKSLIIVMHSSFLGGGFGIAKITLRTNDISSAASSQGEIKWLVRHGFAADALVFNLVNQAKNACMDVFYKSPGTYASMTWYVLSEGTRSGNHSKQWTKYNTNASGTNAYTEDNMKTLRTYASTLVKATDAGHVLTANSANTLATARTINGTSFNGSANITTANWGTARTITIGKTAKSVNGSANVSWTAAEIGVASIDDSTTATGTVWSSNKTQVQINTSYNTMTKRVEALEESISADYVSKRGDTMTGDLTIKKSDGSVSKLNVHRTLSSKDMRGSMDVYSYSGGSVALSTYNMTDNKQTSSYVFGGDAFWSPRNADETIPDIGTSSYRFKKAWLTDIDVTGVSNLKGTIYGKNNIALDRGALWLQGAGGNLTCDFLRFGTNIMASSDSKMIYFIDTAGTRATIDCGDLRAVGLKITNTSYPSLRFSDNVRIEYDVAGDALYAAGTKSTSSGLREFRATQCNSTVNAIIAGKKVFVQSGTPSGVATGDVWIQI